MQKCTQYRERRALLDQDTADIKSSLYKLQQTEMFSNGLETKANMQATFAANGGMVRTGARTSYVCIDMDVLILTASPDRRLERVHVRASYLIQQQHANLGRP